MSQKVATNRQLLLVAMTLANAMILVDQTAVPLSLPNIADGLNVDAGAVQWVLNASLLPLAGLLVLGGRLGDLFGRRRIFLLGSALFGGASAVGGLAPTFPVLLAARVIQGVGGALMLPATVAILSDAYPSADRGRALGSMGGVAAVAGALGPTIGGLLTAVFSWRAVLLVNLPLLLLTLLFALRSVPVDPRRTGPRPHVDIAGAVLLCVALVGVVFALSQTTESGWTSTAVLFPLCVGLVAAASFGWQEQRSQNPLLSFRLLTRHRNYRAATINQGLAGFVEMGLGLILPLLLILTLGMNPALAGLALIPTTLPMVVLAPITGRWYDRTGGQAPMTAGFCLLAGAGGLLAVGAWQHSYWWMLPGFLLYGTGLSIVLTVSDPVSLDTVPDDDHGQASGVSATAEQGGGAVGIALLYALFHGTYVARLGDEITARGLPPLSSATGSALKNSLEAAEQTGLHPATFDPALVRYLLPARAASDFAYSATFLAVGAVGLIGAAVAVVLVRRPTDAPAAH